MVLVAQYGLTSLHHMNRTGKPEDNLSARKRNKHTTKPFNYQKTRYGVYGMYAPA